MKKLYLFVALSFCMYKLMAQNSNLQVGYVQSSLKQNAVNFAINYAEKLEPKLALFKANKSSLLSFSPDIDILLASNDAFNGITAKYVGNIMKFKTTTVDGVEGIADLSRSFHNFPIAMGFESDKNFSYLNGIIEGGWIPWYQNNTKINKYLRQTNFGLFLQAGYKLALNDSLNVKNTAIDESKEGLDSTIMRLKSVFNFSPVFYFDEKDKFGISIIGSSTLWYDLMNEEVYYKLSGKFRFLLNKDYYFDLGYEKGSGAPNFNQGEQFTTNLGIRF